MAAGAVLVAYTSLSASQADNPIESSAKKSYVFKTYLKDDAIKAESKNGAVILTGTVADATHKALAQDTVECLPGVTSVDNRLKVTSESPPEHSDLWINMKVKSALLFHRNANASGTDVYVTDGVVTLRGEASSLTQKEMTTEYARDIDNVKEVRNEMSIVRTTLSANETIVEKIDDASVTAQVKSALMSLRSTSALKTKIQTRAGVVTLSGVAKNEAEKSLVTRMVIDINGVNGLINNMTITAPVAAN